MSVQDLLARLSKNLDSAHVPYMMTGSYASSVHGTPRATQDLDIVIAPNRAQLLALVRLFPDTDYYVSEDAALDALARRAQFNVIDFSTGWKVDFILIKIASSVARNSAPPRVADRQHLTVRRVTRRCARRQA